MPGGCGTQVAARSDTVVAVVDADVDTEESAIARASAESKICVANGSEEAVAVLARMVAVAAGASSAVMYTTGRTNTSDGVRTVSLWTSVEDADCAFARPAMMVSPAMNLRIPVSAISDVSWVEMIWNKTQMWA